MKIYLFIIVICITFFSCKSENQQENIKSEKVIEWVNNASSNDILFQFDSTQPSPKIYKYYFITFKAKINNDTVKLNQEWELEFIPLNINNKPVLAPSSIRLLGGASYEKDFSLEIIFNSDGSFYYLISLCQVFNELVNEPVSGVSFTVERVKWPKELEEILLERKSTDTSLIKTIKEKAYPSISSNSKWCKQIKVVPSDTMLIVSEVRQDSLPTFFDGFDNITIKESGDYLDTLRFREEDLRRYWRSYL